jgi:hypothetical protein
VRRQRFSEVETIFFDGISGSIAAAQHREDASRHGAFFRYAAAEDRVPVSIATGHSETAIDAPAVARIIFLPESCRGRGHPFRN